MKSCDCPRSDHPHGTLRRYAVHRCRCFACRVTHSASQRAYRAGRSWLEVDYRPAIGVRRRLQALAVIGWSANRLAPHLGMTGEYVAKIRADKQVNVRRCTFDAVAAVYDSLWDKPIVDADGRRASTIARRLGYLPPLAWDDDAIDNHDALPSQSSRADLDDIAVERIMAGTLHPPKNAPSPERVEAIRRLAAQGLNDAAIGRRIGMTGSAVGWSRKRHGIPGGVSQPGHFGEATA